jgi:hypothetical protein
MRHNPGWMFFAVVCLALAAGCAKKEQKAEDAPKVTPTKEITAGGPLEKLAAPAGVMVFGGAESPQALVKAVSTMLGPAGAAVTPEVASQGIEQGLKLATGAIDFTKPMRIAVADPKTFKEPLLIAFSPKGGREGLEKALPADKKKDDAGNAFSYSGGHTTYVNFLDEWVVLSEDKDIFAKNRDFLKQLLGAKVGTQVAMVVSVKNLVGSFGAEIDAGLAQVGKMPQQPGVNPQQMADMMKGLAALMHDLETVVVTAGTDGGLTLTFDARPKADTDLAKTAAASSSGKLAMLPKIPADAAFAMVMSMDTEHPSPLMRALMQWSLKSTFSAAGDKVMGITDAFMKACSGEYAYAGYKQAGSENLTMVSLTGVRDAAAVRKGWSELQGVYADPAVKANLEKVGMKIEVKPDAYKIGAVPVTVQETKLDPKNPQMAQMQALLAPMLTSHYAVSDEMAVVAMGKDAKPALEAWLGGKVTGAGDDNARFKAVRAKAADNAVMMAFGSVGGILGLLGMPAIGGVAAGGADGDMSMSLGTKDGALRLVLDLPSQQIQQIAVMAGQLGGRRKPQ